MVLEAIGLLLAVVLVFTGPLLLYVLMQRETQNLPRMGRDEAERRAKEEGKQYNRRDSTDRDRP